MGRMDENLDNKKRRVVAFFLNCSATKVEWGFRRLLRRWSRQNGFLKKLLDKTSACRSGNMGICYRKLVELKNIKAFHEGKSGFSDSQKKNC